MIILLKLLLAHFIGDFLLQPNLDKPEPKRKSCILAYGIINNKLQR